MLESLARGAEFAEIVRGYVERAVNPLLAEVAGLRAQVAELRAMPAVDLAPFVTEAQCKEIAAGFWLKTQSDLSEDVEAAKSSAALALEALDSVGARLDEIEARTPEKGEPGEKGDPGRDGVAPTVDDLRPVMLEMVAAAVADLPPPPRGEKGDPGDPGAKGDPGDPGQPGKDGIGLAGAVIDRDGNLIVTLADGSTRELGPVVGKDGRDGVDGMAGEKGDPGFSLEDFDSEIRDGGRTLVLSFVAGDTKHTVEHQLDTMIYRGAYKAEQEYLPGDTVSCGGQLWHCHVETTDRPDGGSEAWTLCSRRGRDGRDFDPAPLLRLIEEKFKEEEERLIKRVEAYLRSKGT
jgi:hypothetical protein